MLNIPIRLLFYGPLDLTKMVGSARAEALHSLEGIVNRLRDLPEPASRADLEPVVSVAREDVRLS
jgi:hypothetical protein